MTFFAYHQHLLKLAMSDAYARHRSVRFAAAELGMPRSTFSDYAKEFGLDTSIGRSGPRHKAGR